MGSELNGTRLAAVAAGPRREELRPRVPRVPRDQLLLAATAAAGDEPHRGAAARAASQRQPRARSPSRRSRSTRTCCRRPGFRCRFRPVGRRRAGLDRRRIEPRRALADGRSHPRRDSTATRRVLSSDGRLVAHGDPNEKRHIARGELVPEHDVAAALRSGRSGFHQLYRRGRPEEACVGALVNPFGLDGHRRAAARRGVSRSRGGSSVSSWSPSWPRSSSRSWSGPGGAARSSCGSSRFAAAPRRSPPDGWTSACRSRGSDEIRQLGGRVQLDGGSARRAAGVAQTAGAAGDVRPRRGRARARPVAPDPEHRQQLQAALPFVGGPRVSPVFRANVERETEMVKQVLEDLKSIARPIPIERAPMDVNAHLRGVAQGMEASAAEAGVALRIDVPDAPVLVTANEYAMGRVYRNLIQNAIQATAPGGSVTLSSARAHRRVRVRVTDTGSASRRTGCRRSSRITSRRRSAASGSASRYLAASSSSWRGDQRGERTRDGRRSSRSSCRHERGCGLTHRSGF